MIYPSLLNFFYQRSIWLSLLANVFHHLFIFRYWQTSILSDISNFMLMTGVFYKWFIFDFWKTSVTSDLSDHSLLTDVCRKIYLLLLTDVFHQWFILRCWQMHITGDLYNYLLMKKSVTSDLLFAIDRRLSPVIYQMFRYWHSSVTKYLSVVIDGRLHVPLVIYPTLCFWKTSVTCVSSHRTKEYRFGHLQTFRWPNWGEE